MVVVDNNNISIGTVDTFHQCLLKHQQSMECIHIVLNTNKHSTHRHHEEVIIEGKSNDINTMRLQLGYYDWSL